MLYKLDTTKSQGEKGVLIQVDLGSGLAVGPNMLFDMALRSRYGLICEKDSEKIYAVQLNQKVHFFTCNGDNADALKAFQCNLHKI